MGWGCWVNGVMVGWDRRRSGFGVGATFGAQFYSSYVLAKKGPLGRVWLAAHWDRKLNKAQIFSADVSVAVKNIIRPKEPFALRMSGHLLLGVTRIYSRKVTYLLTDASDALTRIKVTFRPGVVDMAKGQASVAAQSITLPESLGDLATQGEDAQAGWLAAFFDGDLQDASFADPSMVPATHVFNVSRRGDITLDEETRRTSSGAFDDAVFRRMEEQPFPAGSVDMWLRQEEDAMDDLVDATMRGEQTLPAPIMDGFEMMDAPPPPDDMMDMPPPPDDLMMGVGTPMMQMDAPSIMSSSVTGSVVRPNMFSPGEGTLIIRDCQVLLGKEKVQPPQVVKRKLVSMIFGARDLKSGDAFGKSDAFVVVKDGDQSLGQSDHVENSSEPIWDMFQVPLEQMADEQWEKTLTLEVRDRDGDTKSELIGMFKTSLRELYGLEGKEVELKNAQAEQKLGFLKVIKCRVHFGTADLEPPVREEREEVHLQLGASEVPKGDTFGKSDAFLKMYTKSGTEWKLIHQTNVVEDSASPKWEVWSESMEALCGGDWSAPLRIECLDYDGPGKEDVLGMCEVSLLLLARQSKHSMKHPKSGKAGGELVVWRCEVLLGSKVVSLPKVSKPEEKEKEKEEAPPPLALQWELAGHGLAKMDVFGKSDGFVLIQVKQGDDWKFVYETEAIKNDLNPSWPPFEVQATEFGLHSKEEVEKALVRFIVYDADDDAKKKRDLIGECEPVLVKDLMAGTKTLSIIHPATKIKKKSYVDSGQLEVKRVVWL